MNTQQLQRALTVLGQAWQHETDTPFNPMGFLGVATLQAFGKGFPDSDSFREALLRCAYDLGEEASQGRGAPLASARLFAQLAYNATLPN